MNIIIYISSFLVIISKFADVYSTARFIKRGGMSLEKNKVVRRMMRVFGGSKVIWAIFVFTVLLVVLVQWQVLQSHEYWYQWAYVATASLVWVFQFAVAHFNFTGKSNFIVRLLGRFNYYR